MGVHDRQIDGTQNHLQNSDDQAHPDGMDEPNEIEDATMTDQDAIWATAEGYTPLAGFHGDHSGMLLSAGPGGESIFTSHPGSLLATYADDDDDDEGSSGSDDAIEGTNQFRDVAEQALHALDEEYRMTVQGPTLDSTDPTLVDSTAGSSLFSTPSSNHEKEAGLFVADFDALDHGVTPPQPAVLDVAKEIPDIDSDAVRRAVNKISLRDPKIKKGYERWEESKKEADAIAPRIHSLIPSAPLAAFRKQSDKAKNATANLSRSASIAEALIRLDILRSQDHLTIHVVGCDAVECVSAERIRTYFSPLIRWIGAYMECPMNVSVVLVGPNVPVPTLPPVDLLPAQGTTGLASAVASLFAIVYDPKDSRLRNPDLVIAFNAGVWGYNEWRQTILLMAQNKLSVPFIATAYTLQESEDDCEVFDEVLGGLYSAEEMRQARLWSPEVNPFRNKVIRPTAMAPAGRTYRENAAWLAWRL